MNFSDIQIKNGWGKVKLKDIAQVIDSLHITPTYADFGYPMVRVTDIKFGYLKIDNCLKVDESVYKKFSKKHIPAIGDLVFSRVGSLGITSYVGSNDKFCLGQNTAFIIPNTKNRFLYFWLTSSFGKSEIDKKTTGASQKTISLESIKNFEICLPPNTEQDNISHTLSRYDDLIENNEKRIKILESMAQKLYTEWFIKFKFPGHEKVEMADSGNPDFGFIPEGWAIKKLVDIAFLVMGQSPTSDNYNQVKEGLPFHQGVADFGSLYPVDRIWSRNGNKFAEHGDLLFSVRAPVGQMNISNKKIILGRGLSAISHKDNLQSLLCLMFMNKFTQKDMIGNGAIYKSVNKNELESLFFVVAKKETQTEFENITSIYFKEIANLSKQNQNLKKSRDLLIPQLVGGQIEIK